MPIQERVIHEWRQPVEHDFHDLILGERLGSGISREVFVFNYDPKYVVKIEEQNHFQNATECMVWEAVMNTEWAKWFAPVKKISPLGTALIMKRTYTPPARAVFPKMLPDFLADSREANWGWMDGRWVVHDYGMTRLITNGFSA